MFVCLAADEQKYDGHRQVIRSHIFRLDNQVRRAV
jgi:hypothetical protein